MSWKHQYKIDGVYQDVDTKELYVPIDVANYLFFDDAEFCEYTENPLVIYRHLDMAVKEHKRYAITLEKFRTKFLKV